MVLFPSSTRAQVNGDMGHCGTASSWTLTGPQISLGQSQKVPGLSIGDPSPPLYENPGGSRHWFQGVR